MDKVTNELKKSKAFSTTIMIMIMIELFTQIQRDLKQYLHAICVLEKLNGLNSLKEFKNFWLIPNFVNKIV